MFSDLNFSLVRSVGLSFLSAAVLAACGGGGGTASEAESDAASATGTPSTSVATTATPAANSTGSVWTACAEENGTCSFSGTKSVRYGVDAATIVRTFTDSATCDNATFGDPAPGQWKTCSVDGATTTTTTTTSSPTTTAPASSIATQGSVSAAVPMAQLGGNVQLLGTYPSLNTIAETGINGIGDVLGSPLRFGKVSDPTGANRQVFRYALSVNDPDTAGTVKRVDTIPPGSAIQKDTVYWSAMEVFIPANTYTANDSSVIADIHIGANCCSGNWGLQLNKGVFQIAKTWDSGSGEQSTWTTVSPQPPADKWLKIIVQWKANATGANGAFIKAWVNGVQVYNDTGPNTVPGGGDYAKFGYYNYTISNGGDTSRPGREVFWRSYHLVKDAGYSLDQVTALLQ